MPGLSASQPRTWCLEALKGHSLNDKFRVFNDKKELLFYSTAYPALFLFPLSCFSFLCSTYHYLT